MASARANSLVDLGPTLPPRALVRDYALELRRLADRAVEFSGTGPTADLGLALKQFDQMLAILGDG